MTPQPIELIQIPDYQQIKQNFLKELTRASQGKTSSLLFVKHPLPAKPLITQGIIQGIVIGGTNYILTTEKIKSDGTWEIIERKTGSLPIFETKKMFVDFLSEHLDQRASAIGVNFGFPMETTVGSEGELDGKLLYRTKEHSFKGLLHEQLGKLVKTILKNRYNKTPLVSVANDTICLALCGTGEENGSLVAGTGFNMGLVLREQEQKVIVNLEAGDFNKFSQSPILKQIDAESEFPGSHLFEKNISGVYLPKHFNLWVKKLNVIVPPVHTGQELSAIAHKYHDETARDVARTLLLQSACLTAAAIAGTYEFFDKPNSFTIIGEGGLLWDGWHYYENIQKQLTAFGYNKNRITIKNIKHSSINGAIGLITK